jgi:hypothetical protein
LLAVLAWSSGHRVDLRVGVDAVVIESCPAGRQAVGSRGELTLPVSARMLAGLDIESRVALVAVPARDVLARRDGLPAHRCRGRDPYGRTHAALKGMSVNTARTSRRTVLSGLATVSAAGLGIVTSPAPAQAGSGAPARPAYGTRPTVVLVHGAFADASSWNGVVQRLQDDGYPVVAVANPLRALAGDAAYLAAVSTFGSGRRPRVLMDER